MEDYPMGLKLRIRKESEPDELIGRIDEENNIYAIVEDEEEYLGWIDYDEGEVYDDEDALIGWAEDDGTIVAYDEEGEEEIEIGYITDEGDLYYFTGEDEEAYLGKLVEMSDYADGAATLLFFVEEEEEE
jgi:hypothetical protein